MNYKIFQGNVFDCLPKIQSESVDLVITSPPYWGLREYGVEGQLGAEPSMEAYLDNLMRWVKEVFRVLKPSGSFVLNLGGCYVRPASKGCVPQHKRENPNGAADGWIQKSNEAFTNLTGIYKEKQFLDVGAFAYARIISETDFVCRNRGTWCKPNAPSPIRSRLKQSTESIDWFVKNADEYFFNMKPWLKPTTTTTQERCAYPTNLMEAIRSGKKMQGKKQLEVITETIEHSWRVVPVGEKQRGFELYGKEKQEHIAPFPEALVKPWVESLCPPEGTVLDPFLGSGTVMKIARDLRLNAVGIELNPKYVEYAKARVNWNNGLDGNSYEVVA